VKAKLPKDVEVLTKKLNALPLEKDRFVISRFEAHSEWIHKVLARKLRPDRDVIKARLLKIADDIRLALLKQVLNTWENDASPENFKRLWELATEVYDRYEDRPKVSLDLGKAEESPIILFPRIKPVEGRKEKNGTRRGEAENSLETPSGTPD
jgi:hypothetical protein